MSKKYDEEFIVRAVEIYLLSCNFPQAVKDIKERTGRSVSISTLRKWVKRRKELWGVKKEPGQLFADDDIVVINEKLDKLDKIKSDAKAAAARLEGAGVDIDIQAAAMDMLQSMALEHTQLETRIQEEYEVEREFIKKITHGKEIKEIESMSPEQVESIRKIRRTSNISLASLYTAKDKVRGRFIDFLEKASLIDYMKQSMEGEGDNKIEIVIKDFGGRDNDNN